MIDCYICSECHIMYAMSILFLCFISNFALSNGLIGSKTDGSYTSFSFFGRFAPVCNTVKLKDMRDFLQHVFSPSSFHVGSFTFISPILFSKGCFILSHFNCILRLLHLLYSGIQVSASYSRVVSEDQNPSHNG